MGTGIINRGNSKHYIVFDENPHSFVSNASHPPHLLSALGIHSTFTPTQHDMQAGS